MVGASSAVCGCHPCAARTPPCASYMWLLDWDTWRFQVSEAKFWNRPWVLRELSAEVFLPGDDDPPVDFLTDTPFFPAEILHLHSPGYELEHFMQRATSFFIPMGIAVAKDWAAYTVIPDQTTGSFFWWTPDPTFLHFTSRQVEFGKRKPVFFCDHTESVLQKQDTFCLKKVGPFPSPVTLGPGSIGWNWANCPGDLPSPWHKGLCSRRLSYRRRGQANWEVPWPNPGFLVVEFQKMVVALVVALLGIPWTNNFFQWAMSFQQKSALSLFFIAHRSSSFPSCCNDLVDLEFWWKCECLFQTPYRPGNSPYLATYEQLRRQTWPEFTQGKDHKGNGDMIRANWIIKSREH